eukprot:gene24878-30886_t
MLHALVKFHFYGKVDLLKSTVKGLVSILRRGDFDLETDDDYNAYAISVQKMSKSTKALSMKKGRSQKSIARSASGISDADHSLSMHDIKIPPPAPRLTVQQEAEAMLKVMCSLRYRVAMMVFVALVCAGTLYVVITKMDGFVVDIFEGIVFIVFAGEWLMRFCVWALARRAVMNFFMDPFHLIDLVSI